MWVLFPNPSDVVLQVKLIDLSHFYTLYVSHVNNRYDLCAKYVDPGTHDPSIELFTEYVSNPQDDPSVILWMHEGIIKGLQRGDHLIDLTQGKPSTPRQPATAAENQSRNGFSCSKL